MTHLFYATTFGCFQFQMVSQVLPCPHAAESEEHPAIAATLGTSHPRQASSQAQPTGDETTDEDEEPVACAQAQAHDAPLAEVSLGHAATQQPAQAQQGQSAEIAHARPLDAAAGASVLPARLLKDWLGTPDSADSEWNPALSGDQKPSTEDKPRGRLQQSSEPPGQGSCTWAQRTQLVFKIALLSACLLYHFQARTLLL